MESSSKKVDDDHNHSKTGGSIFAVCWDRTGQLLCRGSLDGTMNIISTYNPSKPYDNIMTCYFLPFTNRMDYRPFGIVSQQPGCCVYSDCCGIVEAITVNKSNSAFAYAGMRMIK